MCVRDDPKLQKSRKGRLVLLAVIYKNSPNFRSKRVACLGYPFATYTDWSHRSPAMTLQSTTGCKSHTGPQRVAPSLPIEDGPSASLTHTHTRISWHACATFADGSFGSCWQLCRLQKFYVPGSMPSLTALRTRLTLPQPVPGRPASSRHRDEQLMPRLCKAHH